MGGICLLIVAGISVLFWLGDLNADRVIRRTGPTPVGSWRPGAGRVAAEGITDFGPAGRLVGPVSGEVCAWWQVTLTRRPSRGWSEDAYDELLDLTSPGLPAFSDHSGRVLLDRRVFDEPRVVQKTIKFVHRGAAPDALPAIVPAEVVRDLRRGETLDLTEFRLPYALEVFALGRIVGPPGTLSKAGGELTVFAAGGREQVISGRRNDLATGRWMIRGFTVTGLIVTAVGAGLLYLVL